MQNHYLDETSVEEQTPGQPITESPGLTGTSTEEIDQRSLIQKTGRFIKNRVKNYIYNLNPVGKDKFWWTGNLLSAGSTAALYVFAAPGEHLIKSLASAALSVGVYAGERSMERYRNKNWSEERRAEWAAKRQEKFPNGTSRIRRFLLGVSAGGIYGAAFGIPLDTLHNQHNFHPIKNIERHIDSLRKK